MAAIQVNMEVSYDCYPGKYEVSYDCYPGKYAGVI